MGLSATKTEEWLLDDFDAVTEYQTISAGEKKADGTLAVEVTIQKRDHYIVSMRRKFYGLTSFQEESGKDRMGFDMVTSAVTKMSYSSTARKYRCSRDNVRINNHVTGSGEQTQIWEHYTVWEDCDDTEFE